MLRIISYLLVGLAGLVGIAAASIGLLMADEAWDKYQFARRSPLAADLPPEFALASQAFPSRILGRFPIGTPAAEFVKELTQQGFSSENVYHDSFWLKHGPRLPNLLTLTPGPGGSFACRLVWNVAWRADEADRIAELDAEYHGICL
ncbi:hypothetical protein GIW81_06815 [Hyphomicrobium sp. xq]|uniref:Uncharacterized protein n=1 Tax=Hyphomicrobium album TaxID=2665159 RepID=A0A6I3KJX9_9HYPH|nr:hypothetical protein [Hyphomicrobium album]MTD94047.1 hypothetical protein [Hyphomicrobium album]